MKRAGIAVVICAAVGCGAGTKGDTGPMGAMGASGPAGPTGPIGGIGANGTNGVDGPTGPTGPTGPAGMDATAEKSPPLAPTKIWIDERGPRHFLNWKLAAATTPVVASVNIYRGHNSINIATDLAESVSAGNHSTEIDLQADSGMQYFAVSAVSVAGVEGSLSTVWVQDTSVRLAEAVGNSIYIQPVQVNGAGVPVGASTIESVAGGPVGQLHFSPDGKRVGAVGGINARDLFILDAYGIAAARQMTNLGGSQSIKEFDWSPDGKYVWYLISGVGIVELWLGDTTNGLAALVTTLPAISNSPEPDRPSFAPDGSKLIYFATQGGSPTKCEIFAVDAALPLGTAQRLSGTVASAGGPGTLFGALFAMVSPDSRTLLFINAVPNDDTTTNFTIKSPDVYLAPINPGAPPIKVGVLGGLLGGNTAGASWTWSGQEVAFTSDLSPSPSPTGNTTDEVRVVSADGQSQRSALNSNWIDSNGSPPGSFSTVHALQFYPDEQHLFAVFDDVGGVMDAGGGGFLAVGGLDSNYPALMSVTGYVAVNESGGNLAIVDGIGGLNTRVGMQFTTGNDPPFLWLPDGNRLLAIDAEAHLVVVNAILPSGDALTNLPQFDGAGTVSKVAISPLGYRVHAHSIDRR